VRSLIEDDGCGFEPGTALESENHLGLYGIRERVELLGGTLVVDSQVGRGTSICIDVPLRADRSRETPHEDPFSIESPDQDEENV
jgi:nitrate/nitrite-specific signal transduction histidine kinase